MARAGLALIDNINMDFVDVLLGIDSTEMVEISVVIKKELGVSLKDGELKKTHSFNDIVAILKTK